MNASDWRRPPPCRSKTPSVTDCLTLRCPHCQTRFQVTAEQLTFAQGRLRCGVCLQIFAAAEAFDLDESRPATLAQEGPAAAPPEPDQGPAAGDPELATPPAPAPLPARPGERVGLTTTPQADNLQALRELAKEPLRLLRPPKPKHWQRPSLTWAALGLLALLALFGQYINYQAPELARKAAYRPWLATICPLLGCRLGPRVDLNQIITSDLVVRDHPNVPGALLVDALISNQADFAQPFPDLELRFTDLNEHLVASRRFRADEYLAGELAGSHEMPAQIQIHIALEILDPGQGAVSYSLDVLPPK